MKKTLVTLLALGLLSVNGVKSCSASSADVAVGRSGLFNNGSPAVSGRVASNLAFTTAV